MDQKGITAGNCALSNVEHAPQPKDNIYGKIGITLYYSMSVKKGSTKVKKEEYVARQTCAAFFDVMAGHMPRAQMLLARVGHWYDPR